MNKMNRHAHAGPLAVLVLALVSFPTAAADTSEHIFSIAEQAAQEGRLSDMQSAYEQVLEREPNNARALNGRATALAWQGEYVASQSTYLAALAIDDQNLDSLVGLGYAYAWAGDFTLAHTQFNRALNIDPINSGARKGIAYSYQWQGEHELALSSLELAKSVAPNDAEIEEASGRVNLALGHARDAVNHFDNALLLDPDRDSARQARRDAFGRAPVLEINTRLGSTSNAGAGLRSVEVSHWPSAMTRLAVRFDNTLGLDNPSLSDRGHDAPGYFLSAQQQIQGRWQLGAEIGQRDLVGGNQSLLTLQGSYRSAVGTMRLGTQFGRHDAGNTDNLLFGGINFPFGDSWRIEPVLYSSQTGVSNDKEWRSVINAEFTAEALWKAGGYIGVGDIDAADTVVNGRTVVAGIWGSYLFDDRYTLYLGIRRDESPGANITIAELGFTYRLPGN